MRAFEGLNNRLPIHRLSERELPRADNVDLDDSGQIIRREGRERVYEGVPENLWSDGETVLFTEGGSLKRFDPVTNTAETLRTGLPRRKMAYVSVDGAVYYSDGINTGKVGGAWAVPSPSVPILSQTTGNLPLGHYRVAVTQVIDGLESPARISQGITTSGGIQLSGVPSDVRVYCTPPNGDVFYLTKNPVTSIGTVPLETQFLMEPPAGRALAYLNGRLYVARGNRVYRSRPWSFHLFDPRDFWPFSGKVTLLAPVEGGMYVGEDSIWYVPDSEIPSPVKVSDATAIPDTVVEVDGVHAGLSGSFVLFHTSEGVVMGLPNGEARNLTGQKIAWPRTDLAGALLREDRGFVQMVATHKDTDGFSNKRTLRIGDSVDAQVIRNGVLLEAPVLLFVMLTDGDGNALTDGDNALVIPQ